MISPLSLSVFISLSAGLTIAAPTSSQAQGLPAFILCGDSTTAALNPGGGGWGNGFLTTLHGGAIGSNHGYDGTTTYSYVNTGGLWGDATEEVPRLASIKYTPYVTIQFGHNDQKSGSGVTLAQYQTNLETMGQEVQAAGGYPILVTPISRRNFNGTQVVQDLTEQATLTIAAAKAIGATYIDLNKASVAYLNSIGPANAALYNRISTDYTHLNIAGDILFGNMVSVLIDEALAGVNAKIASYTYPNSTIAAAIKSGKFINPSPFVYPKA